MKKPLNSKRHLMVASTLQSVISMAIITNQLHIKGLNTQIISVNAVSMSNDLRYADVFLGIIGDERIQNDQLSLIRENTKAFRLILGKQMSQLRYQPELRFYIDNIKSDLFMI